MTSTPGRAAPLFGGAEELSVLSIRIPRSADRPLPSDEDASAFEGVDPDVDLAVREHLEPFLGTANSTFHDTEGPIPVDIALTGPDEARRWGACFTVGASARALPASEPPAGRARSCVELFLRLPEPTFRYWEGVVLEPFAAPVDEVIELLGDLAKLPHLVRAPYVAPQIVVGPDFAPLVASLPFAGVLLRDAARTGGVRVPPMRGRLGDVTFLSVTFLHPSEVRALIVGDRARTATRFAEAGIDDLLDVGRCPVA